MGENSDCEAESGECLCVYPYAGTGVCEDMGRATGFQIESPFGYASIVPDSTQVANNLDLSFRFYVSADVENGSYHLLSLMSGEMAASLTIDVAEEEVPIDDND